LRVLRARGARDQFHVGSRQRGDRQLLFRERQPGVKGRDHEHIGHERGPDPPGWQRLLQLHGQHFGHHRNLRHLRQRLLGSAAFTAPGSQDFSVGTVAKALGFPGKFENTSAYQGYLDVGAVQHTDPAGGGSTYVINQIRNMFLFNETEP
jgi:hypothetical protein